MNSVEIEITHYSCFSRSYCCISAITATAELLVTFSVHVDIAMLMLSVHVPVRLRHHDILVGLGYFESHYSLESSLFGG